MAVDASPGIARHARTYAELESRVLGAGIEGVALRYGFFYGPGTWYNPEGASADQVRRGEFPIIGDGEGVWSWVHIDDAAVATGDALTIPPGRVHIVDDDPSPVALWPGMSQGRLRSRFLANREDRVQAASHSKRPGVPADRSFPTVAA